LYEAAGTASYERGLEACNKYDRLGNEGFMSARCAKKAPQ